MHGASDNKYTKGRNTSIKTISGNNLFFTPVNSTFDSYNDGTTEFRNDGTVYYKGNKI